MKEYKDRWRLLTATEAYPLFGYRTAKALRLAAQLGFVPRVVIGKAVRFDPDAIREWAANGGTPLQGSQSEEAQKSEQAVVATV